jgi:tight adherence protein C
MNMDPIILSVAIGVSGAIFCAGYLVVVLWDRYAVQVDARLREITAGSAATAGGPSMAVDEHVSAPAAWWPWLQRLVPQRDVDRQKHQQRLQYAGLYGSRALVGFFAAKLLCMLAPPLAGIGLHAAGYIGLQSGVLLGCGAGSVGMLVPSIWLDGKIRKRHAILRRSLADCLDLMTVCLDSGLSIQACIQRVSEELQLVHPILSAELSVVQREIELGATVDAAMRHFANRSGYDAVRTLSTFIRESQRFGTPLSAALRIHAEMLRAQREQLAEETAQKASVKILLPTLLLILPAVYIVLAGPAALRIQEAFAK